jgi:DNA-binding transcriptional LysR family regulator
MDQLTEAKRAASGAEPKRYLVVTAPIIFGRLHVLPIVTNCLEAFPEVSAGLVMTDRVTHFLENQIDVAFRIGRLPDSNRRWASFGT